MVSHELKIPLTSLNPLIQAVSYKLQDSEDLFLRGAMKNANTQIKRMSNISTDFLISPGWSLARCWLKSGHLISFS